MGMIGTQSLAVVGHLGWDRITLGESPQVSRLGGALCHFLRGYGVFGGAIEARTWTTEDLLLLAEKSLPLERVDWSMSVTTGSPAEFFMRYDGLGQELLDIAAAVPPLPPPELLLKGLGASRLHICTMPWPDLLAIMVRAKHAGCTQISVQFHSSTLPSGEHWDRARETFAGTHVFLSTSEFESFVGAEPAFAGNLPSSHLERFAHVRWIITDADVTHYGPTHALACVGGRAIDDLVDTNGAGDVFAGVMCALGLEGSTEANIRMAMAVATYSLGGPTSEKIDDLLRQRHHVDVDVL